MLKFGVPLLAMGVAGGALSARAQGDINMTLNQYNPDNSTSYLTASVTAPDGTGVTGSFGVFSFTVNSFNQPPGDENLISSQTGLTMNSTFNSVCLSPTGTLFFGYKYNYTYKTFDQVVTMGGENPGGFLTADGLADAAWLWNQYGNQNGTSYLSPNQGSALSLAMLELMYYGGPNGSLASSTKYPLTSTSAWSGDDGTGTVPGTASYYYNQYLQDFATAGLAGKVSLPSAAGIFVPDINDTTDADSYPEGNAGQEFIFVEQSQQNGQPVPEPSTWICGALLLLPFGAITLRILRKKSITS